jgi:toxin ParE1/3/4
MKLQVAPLARLDLDHIHDYIARDKPAAARKWLKLTTNQFKLIATNPYVGQARKDVGIDLRSVSHGNYVIFYRLRSNVLEIVRVLHGARDIQGLF